MHIQADVLKKSALFESRKSLRGRTNVDVSIFLHRLGMQTKRVPLLASFESDSYLCETVPNVKVTEILKRTFATFEKPFGNGIQY